MDKMINGNDRTNVPAILEEARLDMTQRDRKDPHSFAETVLRRLPVQDLGPDDIDAVADFLRQEVGLNVALVKRKITRAKVTEALGTYPTNLMEFIRAYAERFGLKPTLRNSVKITKRSSYTDDDGRVMPIQEFSEEEEYMNRFAEIWSPKEIDEHRVLARMKMFREDHGLSFTDAGIDRAWSEWLTRHRSEILFWLCDAVGCGLADVERQEAAEQEWDRFLRAILLDYEKDHILAGAVLSHLIWLVGRKIRTLPVGGHMMPVLIGRQGGGKTEMVKRFLSPLGDAWIDSDFAKLADDRHSEVLANIPVHFLDEMSYASRTDIEVTKRKITAESITYRPLHTNVTKTVRNLASFIGCSNQPLGHSIQDTTGTRRFYAITVKDRLDWEVVNDIQWGLLWASVDAYGPSPLDAMRDAIAAEQESHRVMSSVEEWLVAVDRQFHPNKQIGEWQAADEMFRVFTEFDREVNPGRPTNLRNFGIEMSRLAALAGTRVERVRDKRGVKYRILPAEAD
ncbi:hypothetical protein HL658_03420 [Azospirillum sp. RWY-5-1]|uniref:Virulence-associated protein E-like domain-containing protein n=1 Tax=Azospirillum oleiclasticum TaxID=2735135 RepID=A0ABX2T3U3_9PROT|nr:VapE domain-containing protein [Azospirillum oleiclasticum]NYZ11586.1 hypothetical protein [Azospirillum oleiclasticum]NYZ18747.1 hypothetical protein [Azospirillum oleiclasticum]